MSVPILIVRNGRSRRRPVRSCEYCRPLDRHTSTSVDRGVALRIEPVQLVGQSFDAFGVETLFEFAPQLLVGCRQIVHTIAQSLYIETRTACGDHERVSLEKRFEPS